jgi:hypothetical protein
VIGNYAVPILEDKPVWGTTDETRISYLDSQVTACVLVRCCVLRGSRCAVAARSLDCIMPWLTAGGCLLPAPEGGGLVASKGMAPIRAPVLTIGCVCSAFAQDVARMTLAALRSVKAANKTLTLAGPKAWSTQEVRAVADAAAVVAAIDWGVWLVR